MIQTLSVGIVSAQQMHFRLNAPYTCNGTVCEGDEEIMASAVGMCWRGKTYKQLTFEPITEEGGGASFTLSDVIIGVGFHWQRHEVQSFSGALKLVMDAGKICAINILPIEDYLLSVISSEMSATSSLELLKAHAVISRSWVVRNIQNNVKESPNPNDTLDPRPSSIDSHPSTLDSRLSSLDPNSTFIRWYDTTNHTLFDVCADDHCQRYQGITRQTTPLVAEAIAATRSEVLMSEGKVCDARFSKCCGGSLEQFSSCWQDEDYPYLVAKPDYIDDPRSVNVADAFCNTQDARVLRQVLNSYDQETADFYRWTVHYTREELSGIVARRSGIDFGTILSLKPILRGPSGRIIQLTIVGSKRTVTVGKELEIRKWLSESHLYSSAFTVEETVDGFTLHGRGWGHGVGLCQIGAAVMGSLGYDYREILNHYYPGADIAPLP